MVVLRPVAMLALISALAAPLQSERLPVAAFGVEDGLGHDHVRCAVRDDHGLLWFCTSVGLARFDGVAMTAFGPEDGLPDARAHDLAIAGDRYLVATDRGLYSLDAGASPAEGGRRFDRLGIRDGCADQAIRRLKLDDAGELWLGCDEGLFSGTLEDDVVDVSPVATELLPGPVHALALDDEGTLWAGGAAGLVMIPEGAPPRSISLPAQRGAVLALLQTRDGKALYVGFERGLGIVDLASPADELSATPFPSAVDAERRTVRSLFEDPDGTLWIGAVGTLFALDSDASRAFGVAEGLRDETVNAMVTDRAGNLWLGTDIGGAIRWQHDGLTTFGPQDGLVHTAVSSLTTDRRGRLIVGADALGGLSRHRATSAAGVGLFSSVLPAYPSPIRRLLRHGRAQGRQTRDGRWWIATDHGLFRFPATDRIEDLQTLEPRRFGPAEGLPTEAIRATYEDTAGTLWAMAQDGAPGALARLDPATGRFQILGSESGLPARGAATAIHDDGEGSLWIGWSDGALLVGDGRRFSSTCLKADAAIWDLLRDDHGRLWVATHGDGVYRLEPGEEPEPSWRRYGRDDGLASEVARNLIADRWGRLYIGSLRGVDRLDPETEEIRPFTTSNGLAQLEVTAAHADADGNLWFGTWGGLSRLVPQRDPVSLAPQVRISSLRVDGRAWPVSAIGRRNIGPLRLAPGRHRVDIGFFAIGASSDRPLSYRYRLRSGEWSHAGSNRALTLADLGPGEHRLQISAGMLPDGGEPATLEVIVAQPFWRRAWFLLLAMVVVGGGLFALHRARLRRALAVERIRTRIAADLHDDLGASLSRISLLSEAAVGRLSAPLAETELPEMLEQIGSTARRLTGRAREIVWSLDPRFDDLASFIVRVRETAGELLEPAGIAWTLVAPEPDQAMRIRLRPEQRQHFLLVLKEAMHNAQRHARAHQVEIEVGLHGGTLSGIVRDDGRGFDPDSGTRRGHGLENMRSRVDALGGTLSIGSRRDGRPGGEVRAEVPLA